MDPPRSLPDKPHKKVSRACNTCRLKRKKCNGLDPCLFCTENRVECSYSREPRRRGPPSGYLRYTETRVALFEILLGLFLSRTYPNPSDLSGCTTDPFYESVKTLLAESTTCTQDVWDEHRHAWTVCPSAKMIDDLAMTLSPYSQRPDQEVASKPLLPPVHPSGSGSGAGTATNVNFESRASVKTPSDTGSPLAPITPPPHRGRPVPSASAHPGASTSSAAWSAPVGDSGSDHGAMEFPQQALHTLSRESFERNIPLQPNAQPSASNGSSPWFSQSGLDISAAASDYSLSPAGRPDRKMSSFPLEPTIGPDRVGVGRENQMIMPGVRSFEMQDSNYEGSYWRSVDLAIPDSPAYAFTAHTTPLHSSISLELPPPHILSKMVDVYYSNVWPTFPFLPTRPTLESLLPRVPVQSEAFSTVLLALCAYCGRLSPSSEDGLVGGEAGNVAADLWYEQARSAVYMCIRKGSSVEVAQALLLLALSDHGKGNETQAWILVGMAVRIGQDMDLNGDLPTTYEKKSFPAEEIRLRRSIWHVSLMLDLFLSLQLGRPPASFDCLRSTATYEPSKNEYASHPVPIFLYAATLCRTISRINLHLYLGYDTPAMQSQTEKLNTLKDELEKWYQMLPGHYRIAIGHQSDRPVLELNMLYHVAVILLYRPFCRENAIQHATETLAEAASAFNALLEKYRNIHNESLVSSNSPLSLSNPNMIYIIFTVAIAHLSGYRMRHPQLGAQKMRTATALQTQLHLLNCQEALTSIGLTWRLARRCWKTLDKLMEAEGLKPQRNPVPPDATQANLGKRKREEEDVIGNGRRPFLGGTRGLLPGVHIGSDLDRSALPTFTPTPGNAKPPVPYNVSGLGSTGWDLGTPNASPFSIPTPTLHSELFGPTDFSSSARWLSETQDNDSIGLGIVWNGEWDEQLWTRTMNIGLSSNN